MLAICSGGFLMDAEFTPQRLAELCKMDSAIILTADAGRIARANVHLVPDPSVPTTETGTRHRTAERVARSLRVPVISVSEDMGVTDRVRRATPSTRWRRSPACWSGATRRCRRSSATRCAWTTPPPRSTALEIEDLVTFRDVAVMLQRSETVRRVAEQIQNNIVELGAEAHLIRLQMDELLEDVDDDRELVLLDYLPDDRDERLDSALATLASLTTDELLDLRAVAGTLLPGAELLDPEAIDLDHSLQPRGYRLLDKLPRVSEERGRQRSSASFGTLQKLTRATTGDLASVVGVDPSMAHAVKEGLARLAETTLLDRFH